jgi:cell division protein FtsB
MKKKEIFLKRLIYSKSFFVAGLIILVLFTLALGRRVVERHKINQEIKNLDQEIKKLESHNTELAKLAEYLNTDLYIEEAARVKLGLQKPGESEVIVPDDIFTQGEKKEGNLTSPDKRSLGEKNTVKWWNYFFKK